jgi:DNA (cytosine-5)-methyltransferase 1
METPLMALKKLGVAYQHEFSCDIDKNVKKTIDANCPPKVFYDDLMSRNNETAPAVDLYVAGFPCQSFSLAGLGKGFKDRRGLVFFGVADFIQTKEPRAFILENVKGLLTHDSGRTIKKVLQVLHTIGDGAYNISMKLVDTQDHGVPQSRPRVYIVGVLKKHKVCDFQFPEELQRVSIDNFLEPASESPTLAALPAKSSTTARTNAFEVLKQLLKEGKKPFENSYVIDVDASARFRSCMHDKVMCMTRSRSGGHWVTSRGRRMTLREMMALQGMDIDSFNQVVTDRQLGCQIGNAMSQNVVERILLRLLPAAGLVPAEKRLVDRWSQFVRTAIPSKAQPARAKRASLNQDEPCQKRRRKVTA